MAPKTALTIEYPETIVVSKRVALKALMDRNRPDTIFCMGDMILIGVMYAVHELGLRVPADISIVGISNGFIPTLYNPKITYVETSGYKLGKLAFIQMMEALKQEEIKAEVTLDSMLVEGGSL